APLARADGRRVDHVEVRQASGPTRRRATAGGAIRTVCAVVVFFASAFPVYWMINSSLLPGSVVRASTPRLWPDEFTLDNYVTVLTPGTRSIDFLPALRISLLVTLGVVACALLFAFLGALALSR